MRKLGIEAIYPKPKLSVGNKIHSIYPYLLSGVTIERPDQVWSADITYIRIRGGYMYLVAFIDWYSRYILSWELSNSLHRTFCLEAAEAAIAENIPEIVNFDQGVQFTHNDMVRIWLNKDVQISMDHRGRCFDNIFIERFWRSLKYEEVYIKDYENGIEARESIREYINRYNNKRIHQALGYKTPAAIYYGEN
jgi:putative transposase